MHPLPRRLFALRPSCIKAGGPLYSGAPIGWIGEANPASRRLASTLQQAGQKRAVAKRWNGAKRNLQCSQRGSRFQHTWEKAHAGATSPKRSNTARPIGALFGATALAYLGSVFVSHDHQEENPIKSTDDIDIDDTEGKQALSHLGSNPGFTQPR